MTSFLYFIQNINKIKHVYCWLPEHALQVAQLHQEVPAGHRSTQLFVYVGSWHRLRCAPWRPDHMEADLRCTNFSSCSCGCRWNWYCLLDWWRLECPWFDPWLHNKTPSTAGATARSIRLKQAAEVFAVDWDGYRRHVAQLGEYCHRRCLKDFKIVEQSRQLIH